MIVQLDWVDWAFSQEQIGENYRKIERDRMYRKLLSRDILIEQYVYLKSFIWSAMMLLTLQMGKGKKIKKFKSCNKYIIEGWHKFELLFLFQVECRELFLKVHTFFNNKTMHKHSVSGFK